MTLRGDRARARRGRQTRLGIGAWLALLSTAAAFVGCRSEEHDPPSSVRESVPAPTAERPPRSDRPWRGDDKAASPATRVLPDVDRRRAVVWAVGDGADGSVRARRVASAIAAGRVDRVLFLGDVYDEGTAAEFRDNYQSVYGRFAQITAPTPGNHDWPNAKEGYLPYWGDVHGREMPTYYELRVAGWEILSLNSEGPTGADSAQVRWLERATSERGTCRIAFWHRARFSAGEHGDEEDLAPLWDALRGHASIVLAGHDHNMQRFPAIDGMVSFVSGAGGRSHYELESDPGRLAFGDDETYGALRLELERGLARYAFVSDAGRELDSGQVRCEVSTEG